MKMIYGKFIIIVLALVLNAYAQPNETEPNEAEIRKAVVRIITVYQEPDFYVPWQMKPHTKRVGSGCVISNERILTNAHAVSNQTFIQVQRSDSPKKYTARLIAIAHECDLALLTVDDKSFFKDIQPLKLGHLPFLRDKIVAYGFPIGGDKISITEGIVSRIEQQRYYHSNEDFLAVQVDAAINPGNSGGPVIQNGKISGLAFQGWAAIADNIGYIIPAPIIEHFLKDVEDKKYDGFPYLSIQWQDMENESLRSFYQMKPDQTGVLVNRVVYNSSAWNNLEEGDIILSIDNYPIANDGTVEFRKEERLDFTCLIQKHFLEEKICMQILRKGEALSLSFPLKKQVLLVEGPLYETHPTYYILGGLVFIPLTQNYLETWGNNWGTEAPSGLLYYHYNNFPSKERKEIVVLQMVLAHDINIGYHNIQSLIIRQINGQKISTLNEAIKALNENKGVFHVIETESKERIVLKTQGLKEVATEILKRYQIPSDRSKDLLNLP
ncbi:MAG: trypsin-like peptidase domain-containing protein [Candidatus Omnitrophota bacterium]|nr:trypsin-like peptidase domain-containing protein [Candidatus Omnitrophota bacterium]